MNPPRGANPLSDLESDRISRDRDAQRDENPLMAAETSSFQSVTTIPGSAGSPATCSRSQAALLAVFNERVEHGDSGTRIVDQDRGSHLAGRSEQVAGCTQAGERLSGM